MDRADGQHPLQKLGIDDLDLVTVIQFVALKFGGAIFSREQATHAFRPAGPIRSIDAYPMLAPVLAPVGR